MNSDSFHRFKNSDEYNNLQTASKEGVPLEIYALTRTMSRNDGGRSKDGPQSQSDQKDVQDAPDRAQLLKDPDIEMSARSVDVSSH